MAFIARDEDDDQPRGDMTPMIDIIFLLLIFFILTTTFTSPEKAIASLMPTDKGAPQERKTEIEPEEEVTIRIWPADIDRNAQPSELDAAWLAGSTALSGRCLIQIGNEAPLQVDGAELNALAGDLRQEAAVGQVHNFVVERLRQRELDGPRSKQSPVVIRCFSGLSWKYAAIVYDAVRGYESLQTGERISNKRMHEQLPDAREVSFAPPLVRTYHQWERGNELFSIINAK